MTTFSQRLAAAKAAPRPHRDVHVLLDTGLAERRDALLEQLADAEERDASNMRLAAKNDEHSAPIRAELDEIAQAAASAVETIRITRIPGDQWAEIVSRHPARIDVPLDTHYGYNYDAVCNAAAVYRDEDDTAYVHRFEGDELIPLERGEWFDLISVVSGNEATELRDAVWSLNEYEPSKAIDLLVKSFGVATRSENE
ncbi:hypothetical protein [Microbacterium arborescens]